MTSAFSQSTFPSADYTEPSPPPPKRGLSREGSHETTALCQAPVLARATLSWTGRPPWPRAAGCTAGCCLAAGGGKSRWRWHGASTGDGSRPGLRKHLWLQAGTGGGTVSAEWGRGLQEHLPLLSLAEEMAKEGPTAMDAAEFTPASAPRLPRAGCMSTGVRSLSQGPVRPRGRQLWGSLQPGAAGAALHSPGGRGERPLLGTNAGFLTALSGRCKMTGWQGEDHGVAGAGAGIGPWA